MRPPGEIHHALLMAAQQLADERGGATWRDLAERSGVGYRVALYTVRNMARGGALQPVGAEKRAHSRRWMTLYAPTEALLDQAGQPPADLVVPLTGVYALAHVARAWVMEVGMT